MVTKENYFDLITLSTYCVGDAKGKRHYSYVLIIPWKKWAQQKCTRKIANESSLLKLLQLYAFELEVSKCIIII